MDPIIFFPGLGDAMLDDGFLFFCLCEHDLNVASLLPVGFVQVSLLFAGTSIRQRVRCQPANPIGHSLPWPQPTPGTDDGPKFQIP